MNCLVFNPEKRYNNKKILELLENWAFSLNEIFITNKNDKEYDQMIDYNQKKVAKTLLKF